MLSTIGVDANIVIVMEIFTVIILGVNRPFLLYLCCVDFYIPVEFELIKFYSYHYQALCTTTIAGSLMNRFVLFFVVSAKCVDVL